MSSGKYRQQDVRAARGTTLTAKSWLTEAPLRMLMNNLDPEVAENPHELVVYGGIGRAARNWECYDAIVKSLTHLEHDETLLVQSGKPVGVFKTHKNAPRVLIANSNLVPHWATWEHFNELDAKGLAMYGQMTAGSWIYIGSQGIVQGTYETFVEAGRQHYNGSLKGRWVLTAGLGGMGGAQPLAATLAGACSLNIECQQSRIDFRLRTRYVDEQADNLDDALARIKKYTSEGKAVSIALCGNAAEILPELNTTVYSGLAGRGNLSIPKAAGVAPVFKFYGEAEEQVDSIASFTKVTLTPKAFGGAIPLSKQAILTAPNIEQFVQSELMRYAAQGLEQNVMDKIVAAAPVHNVATAGTVTLADVQAAVAKLAQANVDMRGVKAVMNAKTLSTLRQIAVLDNTAAKAMVEGYRNTEMWLNSCA